MLSAYYSYEHADYINYTNLVDPRLVNAPQHLGSFKGVVPVISDVLSLAARITMEAPRRIAGSTDPGSQQPSTTADTPWAAVADLVASGNLKTFGVTYALGVYNVMDSKYVYPVSPSYLSSTLQQPGRTFVGDVTFTWP
jgi:hypothetical protein